MFKLRSENGGLTLEAAIIFPFFIAFIVAMIVFVKVSITQMALHNAVSEATKQVATHMYPASLATDFAKEKYEQSTIKKDFIDPIAKTYEEVTGEADSYIELINEELEQIQDVMYGFEVEKIRTIAEIEQEVKEQVVTKTIEYASPKFTFFIMWFADEQVLEKERLKLVWIDVPNMLEAPNMNNRFFGMEVEYTMTLPIPFFQRDIKLYEQAYERVWVGRR